jgi:alpha-tubulin suppressor-like RCC1 family protein
MIHPDGPGVTGIVGRVTGAAALVMVLVACAGGPGEPLVAAGLQVAQQPYGATSGLVLQIPPIVRVVSADGRPVPGASVAVTVHELAGRYGLEGTLTRTSVDGTVEFPDLRLEGVGQARLVFEAPGLTPATSGALAVAQVPASLVVYRQPEGAISGKPLDVQPLVTIMDNAGLILASSNLPVTVTRSAGPGVLSGTTTVTSSAGTARFTDLVLTGAGTSTLSFAAGSLPAVAATPLVVSLPQPLVLRSIAADGFRTCGVTTAGAGYCWGTNAFGGLGAADATSTRSTVPRRVSGGFVFTEIAVGGGHACGLESIGVVQCWGYGVHNQLGRVLSESNAPGAVPTPARFTRIAARSHDTCAIATDSIVHCWGYNVNGELGDGTTDPRVAAAPVSGTAMFTDIQMSSVGGCGLTTTSDISCWGGYALLNDSTAVQRLVPRVVPLGSPVTAMMVGGAQCGLITGSGWLCVGTNSSGQRGDGTKDTQFAATYLTNGLQFVSLTGGFWHSCGLTATGDAYCWGLNDHGQLGDGTQLEHVVPEPVAGGLKFAKIVAAQTHTCAITLAGAPYCWGWNLDGELGDGTQIQRLTPTAVIPP